MEYKRRNRSSAWLLGGGALRSHGLLGYRIARSPEPQESGHAVKRLTLDASPAILGQQADSSHVHAGGVAVGELRAGA